MMKKDTLDKVEIEGDFLNFTKASTASPEGERSKQHKVAHLNAQPGHFGKKKK